MMISLVFLVCFIKAIYSSVPFLINPGCDLIQCQTPGHAAIYYANHSIGDDTIHILYSSCDELTISIIQTKSGVIPTINYTALFTKNYSNAISFENSTPLNSFSLIIRRLIKFNDQNDTGRLDDYTDSIESFWLNGLITNITLQDNKTDQPSFQLPLEKV